MRINIITDNPNSWFVPYGYKLKEKLEAADHDVLYVFSKNEIIDGDINFLLSCSRIIEDEYLSRNSNNIVVHASDLPKGRGFAPLQWQILEGKNQITLTLFEVVSDVDSGPYYLKEKLRFSGSELYLELRSLLAEKIIAMCLYFVEHRNELCKIEQKGEPSYYRRRSQHDDEVDINKSIKELFNHFRIADNEKYPLYFYYDGKKYYLKIYPEEIKNI